MSEISGTYRPPPQNPRESHLGEILIALGAVGALFYVWMSVPGLEAPLMISIICLMLVVSFKYPSVPCIVFVIFSFLRVHEAFPALSPYRIPQILAQIATVVAVWHLVLARSVKLFWTRELTLFAVFFAITTATLITSTSRETSYFQWSEVYSKIAVIVLVLTWVTRSAGDFQLIARLLAIAGTAVAAVAIYNKLNGIGLVEGTRVTIGRSDGSVLGDPNDLSLALLFPLSFAAALMMGRVNGIDRLLGAISVGTIMMGIFFTQSRGGLLGVAAIMAILASRYIRNKAVLITIGVVAVLALFAFAGISGRSSGGAGQGIDESSEGRLTAWQTAFNMALHRPLTGVGLGTFVDNYFDFTPEWDGKAHAVHSTWFVVLAETGFPGFFVFMALVITTGLANWRCLKLAEGPDVDPRLKTAALALAAGMGGFCVSGTFLTQGFTWPFYIMFALTMALSKLLTEGQEREAFTAQGLPIPRHALPAGGP